MTESISRVRAALRDITSSVSTHACALKHGLNPIALQLVFLFIHRKHLKTFMSFRTYLFAVSDEDLAALWAKAFLGVKL